MHSSMLLHFLTKPWQVFIVVAISSSEAALMLDLNESAFNLSVANVSIANQSNQSDANQSVVVAIEDEEPTPQRDEPERKSTKGVVRRLSPTSGSLCGGTRLSISGSGFAEIPSANRVEIGGTECEIEDVSS